MLVTHRQRIGKKRTKHGLRPTHVDITKRIDKELCATAPVGSMHLDARHTGYCFHMKLGIGAPQDPADVATLMVPATPINLEPLATDSSGWFSFGQGGPW